MIARDEESDIRRCLESACSAVSEMVVVDTGSSDRTVEIATACGARVVKAVWSDDFSAARNRSLSEASGELALVLDADEELVNAALAPEEFRRALADSDAWGWQLRVRNLNPPGEMLDHTDVSLTRLLRRRAGVSYESPIHEQVTPSILRAGKRIGRLDVTILHHGYARRHAQGMSRASRNLAMLQRLVADRPLDPYVHYQLGCAYHAAGDATGACFALRRARDLGRVALSAEVRSNVALRLSQLALQRRDDLEALGLARESLALDPDNAVALQVVAAASVGAGDVGGGHAALLRLRARPSLRPASAAQVDDALRALEAIAGRRR